MRKITRDDLTVVTRRWSRGFWTDVSAFGKQLGDIADTGDGYYHTYNTEGEQVNTSYTMGKALDDIAETFNKYIEEAAEIIEKMKEQNND